MNSTKQSQKVSDHQIQKEQINKAKSVGVLAWATPWQSEGLASQRSESSKDVLHTIVTIIIVIAIVVITNIIIVINIIPVRMTRESHTNIFLI